MQTCIALWKGNSPFRDRKEKKQHWWMKECYQFTNENLLNDILIYISYKGYLPIVQHMDSTAFYGLLKCKPQLSIKETVSFSLEIGYCKDVCKHGFTAQL